MPADKPTELSRIKLKDLNSTARPYDQQAFSPPDPTAIWHSHLALAIYIFVVVNFDALAQASDFRITTLIPIIRGFKMCRNPISLPKAVHLETTEFIYIYNVRTYIHTYLLLLISMLWHRQAIFESKGDKLSSSAECRIRTQGVSETQSSAD